MSPCVMRVSHTDTVALPVRPQPTVTVHHLTVPCGAVEAIPLGALLLQAAERPWAVDTRVRRAAVVCPQPALIIV